LDRVDQRGIAALIVCEFRSTIPVIAPAGLSPGSRARKARRLP